MVKLMEEIKKGDYVTRKSYNNDTVFKVLNIKDNTYYLKGVDVRLYADSTKEDLIKVINEQDREDFTERVKDVLLLDRDEFFYLPGKILHFDTDTQLSNHAKTPVNKGKIKI